MSFNVSNFKAELINLETEQSKSPERVQKNKLDLQFGGSRERSKSFQNDETKTTTQRSINRGDKYKSFVLTKIDEGELETKNKNSSDFFEMSEDKSGGLKDSKKASSKRLRLGSMSKSKAKELNAMKPREIDLTQQKIIQGLKEVQQLQKQKQKRKIDFPNTNIWMKHSRKMGKGNKPYMPRGLSPLKKSPKGKTGISPSNLNKFHCPNTKQYS
mmetsp:Transcript_19153/g.16976  ORF Transcript_19153/g.16976 Transcript_19153/m.16976 type:complete len:214 (+) Transcript_19153:161-802(+)